MLVLRRGYALQDALRRALIAAVRQQQAAIEPHPEVIVYCDCPNEASAATLARELKRRGFGRVRPLAGGFVAWQASGYEVARDA